MADQGTSPEEPCPICHDPLCREIDKAWERRRADDIREATAELQAKLEQAERALAQARDGAFANIAEAEVIKRANRATAAESALAAARAELEVAWSDCHDGKCRACAKCCDAAESALKALSCNTVRNDKPGAPRCGGTPVCGFCMECLREHAAIDEQNESEHASLRSALREARAVVVGYQTIGPHPVLDRIDAALAAESGKPGGEAWRRLLFLRHGCTGPALYGDDGEQQCKACGIDFRRDTLEQIEARWREPRAAPPALPAELSGKGEQRAYSHEHVFDTQLLCKVCGGCALDLAEEAAEPGEAKKEEGT